MPELNGSKEREMLLALKAGSHQAFEYFYHHYKRRVYYGLYRLVHQSEVAEELTHDVFLKIWQLRDTVDANKSFGGFLRRIAGNLAVDFYRRVALDRRAEEELIHLATAHHGTLDEELEWGENFKRIQTALNKLPQRRREIFILCKLEGKRYADVAKSFGIGVGTVNDHIVKATKFIKNELAKHPDGYLLLLLVAAFSFLNY